MKANEASKESRLLETAYKLFTRKGVKDTSIQEIADNADVGKGTFYLYFKDKYEIRDVLIYRKSNKLFNDAYKESKKQNYSNLTDQIIFIIDSVINKLIKNQVLLKFISKNLSWGVFNDTLKNVYTISNEEDTDGIYDMVKNFLKEYNSIINEMDKLYNAEDSKLDPLTEDEKYALSDKEVEDWENKLKSSALRRDDNLSLVSSGLRQIMSSGINIGEKTFYLSDFGIEKLGYFNAPDNEKNAYHIAGDPDDSDTSGNADKLKSMIASDPSTVISFFTKISQNLYDKMSDMSKSVDGYRSYGSFFDDKKMKSKNGFYRITESQSILTKSKAGLDIIGKHKLVFKFRCCQTSRKTHSLEELYA